MNQHAMNQYATMALRHWRRFRPNQYAQIADPIRFFSELGSRVETGIADLAEALAGEDVPGETFLAKTGRLTAARQRAQEMILAEEVLVPAEPGTEMDETDPEGEIEDQDEPEETGMPPAGMRTGWIPRVEDPTHPF